MSEFLCIKSLKALCWYWVITSVSGVWPRFLKTRVSIYCEISPTECRLWSPETVSLVGLTVDSKTLCLFQKLQGICVASTYWTTALLSEVFFLVRAACKIRLVSFGSKHALQSLSNMPFVCTYMYTCTLKTTQLTYTVDVLHIKWQLYYWRYYLCGLELHEKSKWRAMAPDMHHNHSLTQDYVCILQAWTYIAIWCTTRHDSKTCVAYDCTTHQMMALLPMLHCSIRTKPYVMTYALLQPIASVYTSWCLSKYSGRYKYMYTNIKINKYYCISW